MQQRSGAEVRVGVVSDTHGLLRPQVVKVLEGSDVIVHAGDVGDASVIEQLERIAPVHAVRGNVDWDDWARAYPETLPVQLGAAWLYVLHDVGKLDVEPGVGGFDVVVHGHSHMPRNERRGSVLFFNPGSCGPRRFSLPVSVGRLLIRPSGIVGEVVDLDV